MNIKNLCSLIEQGESITLEFKTSTATLKEAFQTVCGMLNNNGGIVLIGINDAGKMIGQAVSDKTKKEIAEHIKKIEPVLNIDIQYLELKKDTFIIVLKVLHRQNLQVPYLYDGRPYQRIESTTLLMRQSKYHEMLDLRKTYFSDWEQQPSIYEPSKKVLEEILDEGLIRQFIQRAVSNDRLPRKALNIDIFTILAKIGLIQKQHGLSKEKLVNAALILFGKDLERNYPQCLLRLARFKGNDKLKGFVDNKQFYANAFEMLDLAEQFITTHLPISSTFSQRIVLLEKMS